MREIANVVYFVTDVDELGPIKIGSSRRPVIDRMVDIQIGNPNELMCWAILDFKTVDFMGTIRDLERWTHHELRYERIRGEWFARTKAVVEFVKNYGTVVNMRRTT